jgi:hypothetical protein
MLEGLKGPNAEYFKGLENFCIAFYNAQAKYEEAAAAIQPGIYRHFKGNEYEVLEIARHSETLEPMVVYRALYGEGGVWVRPAKMWNEPAGDGTVRRFTKI